MQQITFSYECNLVVQCRTMSCRHTHATELTDNRRDTNRHTYGHNHTHTRTHTHTLVSATPNNPSGQL